MEKLGLKKTVSYAGMVGGLSLIVSFFIKSDWIALPCAGFGAGISFVIQYLYNQLLIVDFVDEDEKKEWDTKGRRVLWVRFSA